MVIMKTLFTSRMEMRTVAPLLLFAAVFCFDPATSKYINNGNEGINEESEAMTSCLQVAMAKNFKAVDSVIEFLCSYLKSKNMTNKEELIQAAETLKNVTGCSTEDVFGTDTDLEQVAMDANGVLTSQTIAMEQLLKSHVIMPITEAVCAIVDHIGKSDIVTQSSEGEVEGNKRTPRDLLSLLGGLTGGLGGLGGILNLLSVVGKIITVIDPVLQLLGGVLDGLSGVTNLVGGLGNGVTGLVGGLTGGLLGGGQKNGDLLGNLLGGVGGTLSGLTGGLLGGGGGGPKILGILGR